MTNVPLGFMQIVLNLFHNCPEWNDHTSYEQDKTEARHDVTGVCENVISEKTGKIIRKKGDKYDAHHIIENTFGGEHEWWNIHPAKFPNEHQAGIHGTGLPANTLFKGGKK